MNTFAADLLAWFDEQPDDLAWRGSRDPYRVWLSEIMLQQTQVATVAPYFARFIAAYPTVEALAAAPLDDVLKRWEGLGYYSRARNLHRTAQIVANELQGEFPQTVEGLMALPGIGRYTAGAIASIAFETRAPVVDGNVIRVLSRMFDIEEDVTQTGTQARLWAHAEDLLPEKRIGDFNQALMRHGRRVCKPRDPLCEACPVRTHCLAYLHGTQRERPVKKAKEKTPHYDVTAGLIWDGEGRLLIAQRPLDGLLGGLWEFPGGKQEAGETLEDCLKRELREELGIEVEVGELFAVVKHGFSHFRITLHAFTCHYLSGPPQAIHARDWAWVTPDGLDAYTFGKADRQVIEEMRARRGMLL